MSKPETQAPTAIADRLLGLANRELEELTGFLNRISNKECGCLLIEACRCLDHAHVIQQMSSRAEAKLASQDFDIIVRGWNVFFSMLLSRLGRLGGVPMAESTPKIRQAVMGMLHSAGRYVLLSRTAGLIRHGMVSGAVEENEVTLWLWAIGRSNARFRSYGYANSPDVLVLPWSQLVRLRYAIGPAQRVFALITQRVFEEAAVAIERTPLPYVLDHNGVRVTFKDIWSTFDDG